VNALDMLAAIAATASGVTFWRLHRRIVNRDNHVDACPCHWCTQTRRHRLDCETAQGVER
jgi:hypothetical protein